MAIGKYLTWFSSRVTIDGILDVDERQWSFERALLTGLVDPPPFTLFYNKLNSTAIAHVLYECRKTWARFDRVVRQAQQAR
jgi:hypothetical protein